MGTCPNFQQVKVEHLKSSVLAQIIEVPTLKWESINMDFVVGHSKTRGQHDPIWVIVGRITMSAHFIPMKSTYRAENYERLYIEDIVRRHGIPLSIISY